MGNGGTGQLCFHEPACVNHVLHLLTPETEKATHYFWSITRNYWLGEADLTEALRASVSATFDEDKIVLEQQQQPITRLKATVPRVAIKLDETPMRACRLLDQWVKKKSETLHSALVPLRLLEDLCTPVAQ